MADQNPSDSPSLPPIPAIPFQAPFPAPTPEPRSTAVPSPASVTTTVSVTPPPRSEAQIPSMPAGQPAATPKGPLYEDPDLVKTPGAS